MVQVRVADVVSKETQLSSGQVMTTYAVILADDTAHRALVIWIAGYEGVLLTLQLNNLMPIRPMTQQFIFRLLQVTGAKVEGALIHAEKAGIFYAVVPVRVGFRRHEIDARPSDALLLALQYKAPIHVNDALMKSHSVPLPAQRPKTGKGMQAILNHYKILDQPQLADYETITGHSSDEFPKVGLEQAVWAVSQAFDP
jgi:bifunctional DNase/RNase